MDHKFTDLQVDMIFYAVVQSRTIKLPAAEYDAAKEKLQEELDWWWPIITSSLPTTLTSTTRAKEIKNGLCAASKQAEALLQTVEIVREKLVGMFPPYFTQHDPPEYTEALKGSLHDGAPSLWELEAGLKQLRDTAKLAADFASDEASWPDWRPRDMKYSRLGAIYREVFETEPRPSVNGPFGRFLGAVHEATGRYDGKPGQHIKAYKDLLKKQKKNNEPADC